MNTIVYLFLVTHRMFEAFDGTVLDLVCITYMYTVVVQGFYCRQACTSGAYEYIDSKIIHLLCCKFSLAFNSVANSEVGG